MFSKKYNIDNVYEGQQRPEQYIEHKMLSNIVDQIIKDPAHISPTAVKIKAPITGAL
ncbi:hypothetical protein D3C80_1740550 [compost metagenome]